jgi:hypothetical protein
MIHEQFYLELGKFLYAIALSDGSIQPDEIKKLEKIISDQLDAIRQDHEHVEENEIILSKLSFYNCLREHATVKVGKRSFINFLEKYGDQLHDHERHLAVKLISAVSSASYGISPQELLLIKAAENYFKINK